MCNGIGYAHNYECLPLPITKIEAASDVIVNLSEEYQVIRGFGGMNHPEWIET